MNKTDSINKNSRDEETIIMNEDRKIIENMQKEHGSVSKALKLMSKRPGALNAFMLFRNQILNNGPLSNKERTLIMLATTVALKSESCIAVQAKNAKNAGASEEEIIQTMLTVGLVSGNNPLNVAYSSYFEDNEG